MGSPVARSKHYDIRRFVIQDGVPVQQVYFDFWRTGYVQSAPYVNTPVTTVISRALDIHSNAGSWGGYIPEVGDFAAAVTNRAYAKFVSQVGEGSQFGSTLTSELRATWGTVVDSIVTAGKAAKAVRRGDLLEAARLLGFYPPVEKTRVVSRRRKRNGKYYKRYQTRERWVMPNGRKIAKSSANKWLWYSYGIKPLVQDVYNGMDVLTRDVPTHTAVFAASSNRGKTLVPGYASQTWDYSFGVRVKAKVTAINPNLWLANQLGLINPIQMINEGIKLSFVADWFSNLTPIINSMTDFVGLRIEQPVTSTKLYCVKTVVWPWGKVESIEKKVYTRALHVPTPRFQLSFERFQWQRGANAISLLVGYLPRK